MRHLETVFGGKRGILERRGMLRSQVRRKNLSDGFQISHESLRRRYFNERARG